MSLSASLRTQLSSIYARTKNMISSTYTPRHLSNAYIPLDTHWSANEDGVHDVDDSNSQQTCLNHMSCIPLRLLHSITSIIMVISEKLNENVYRDVCICLIGSCSLSFWYRCPSTLFLYLTWISCIVPLEGLSLVHVWITRRNTLSPTQDSNHYFEQDSEPRVSQEDMESSISLAPTVTKPKPIRMLSLSIGIAIWLWTAFEALTGSKYTTAQSDMHDPHNSSVGPTYIAVNLYNSAELFPRFTDNLLKLTDAIGGPPFVYISIFESNSEDGGRTERALADLSHRLEARDIANSIISGRQSISSEHDFSHSRSDHIGVDGDSRSRIAFLAGVRNRAMMPLYESNAHVKAFEKGYRSFSRVLWLNDIVFDPSEIEQLLHSNKGSYDAACAFDYIPLGLYDTWVTRDIDGRRPKPLWPYFFADRDVRTLIENRPILVNSCWNGAIAFDARWFSDEHAPLNKPSKNAMMSDIGAADHVSAVAEIPNFVNDSALPLRFRHSDICVSSECLLLSTDIHRALRPKRPVIVMNPRVVATYDTRTYTLYHDIMRWNLVRPWQFVWERLVSAYLFRALTDLGRKTAECQQAFQDSWSPPHPLARLTKSNTEILDNVLAHRWQ